MVCVPIFKGALRMSPTHTKKSEKQLLRQKVEKLFSKKLKTMPKIQPKDIEALALIHGLQVHQVELEMQNEELRKAQAEIEESRTKYSDLYDFSPAGYFTFNQAGEILEVNLTGASFLGVDRPLLLHTPFSTFVDSEFRSLFRDHRLGVLRRGAKERCELKLVKKNGMPFYASLESISIPYGKTFRIRSVVSDVTELKRAQEKAEIEHAFRISIEKSIPSGIAVVSLEGQLSYVNPGFCRMVGRSEKELLKTKPPFTFWPPEELDRIKRAFQAMLDGKSSRDGIELRFMRKNGERFDVLVAFSQLKDLKGNLIGWVETFGDITHLKQMENKLTELNTQLEERARQRTAELETVNRQLRQEIAERKQAEEAVRESESRYRSLFDHMINGFAYHKILFNDEGKPIDYVYLEVNDAFENLTGLKKRNVIGKRVTEVLPGIEKDPVDWIGIYGRVVKSGKPIKFENYSEALKKWYSVSAYSPRKDYFATVFEDITERKGMEEETQRLLTGIQQEKERLSALVNSINDEVWLADTQERFTLANPSALSEFGLSSTDTIEIQTFAKNLEVYHSDGRPRSVEEAPPLRALKGEVLKNLEEIVRTPASGELRHRQVSASPVTDSRGNIIGSVSVVRDITDRKRMEEALRTSKEKFEILSETASRLLATHRPQELVNELCQKVMAYLDCHAFFNYLADEEKQRLHLNAYSGIPEETGKEIEWLDFGVAVCGCAAQDASRIVCENIPETSDVRTELVKSFGIKAYACHPLFSAGRVIGTLSFGTRSRTTFTEEELSLMKTVADQVAMAMEKMSLIDALRKSRDELEIRVQKRTAELAKVNEGLKVEIAERKQTEEALRKLTYDLNKRVKEVNCLYSVSYYVDKQHLLLNEKLKHIVNIIPSGWRFAELTCARIVLEGQEYKTENLRETPWRQSSDIIVHGEKIGMIEVFYLEKKPEEYEGPFFKEERNLINAIAVELGEMVAHKRADEAVKAERQRFYDVLEMLPAYLVLLTPDYHMPFSNRFFRERFGESHGKRCFEYLFGRSEPCEVCESYTVLKTGAVHKWEWTGPDGRIYDVTDFPFTDTDGSTLILEMGIDITERKRAEEALRAAHGYTRSLIEASPDPLVTISADGKIMDVNRATEHATGVARQQLIGSDFSDYFTDPVKARVGYRQVFEKGSVRDYPLAIQHTSGMITDVLYNATIYRNEAGGIQGIFAAARDITDRKRVEEALRESENRLRVLSSQLLTAQESERKRIAMELHDGIGQMLTAIKFKVENTLHEKQKIGAKGKSLEAIIPLIKETMEEVRRMQMDLRPSTLDDLGVLATLGWFCREYQKIYSHIRVDKEIGIEENEVSTPLKVVLYRLTQEAMNNIAKHSQADLVRLSLRKQETEIEWVIEDNGIGFDLEKILFPEGSKRGLGLSSIRERVELSGGKLMIESTQGKGTTVRASWPL
jgi:PAS domain S-box-containing protein